MRQRSRPVPRTRVEEWSAAGDRQPPAVAFASAAAAAAQDPTGSESAARAAPPGRTGCWARRARAAAASAAASEAAEASVGAGMVAEQGRHRPVEVLLHCARM